MKAVLELAPLSRPLVSTLNSPPNNELLPLNFTSFFEGFASMDQLIRLNLDNDEILVATTPLTTIASFFSIRSNPESSLTIIAQLVHCIYIYVYSKAKRLYIDLWYLILSSSFFNHQHHHHHQV